MDVADQRVVAEGLRSGKVEAWRALYEAYCRPVWDYVARRMAPASADVADVVQETFLAAARSARAYDPSRGSLWAWLTGIAHRHVALHFRRKRRFDGPEAADGHVGVSVAALARWLETREATPPEALAAAETAALVRATLTELPADYGVLLSARYLDGESVDQIAGHQRCSTTAVRSRLARARRAFRQAFVKAGPRSEAGVTRGEDASGT